MKPGIALTVLSALLYFSPVPATLAQSPSEPSAQAPAPVCRFDTVKSGVFESVAKTKRGYEISLAQEGGVFTATVTADMPFYDEAEKLMTEEGQAESSPHLAFLFQGQELCSFMKVSEELLYLDDYHSSPGKYVLHVCEDETGSCFNLAISRDNPLFNRAEEYLPDFLHNVMHTVYTKDREILSAVIYLY